MDNDKSEQLSLWKASLDTGTKAEWHIAEAEADMKAVQLKQHWQLWKRLYSQEFPLGAFK